MMSLANAFLALSQEVVETVVQTETGGNNTLITAAAVSALAAAVAASQVKKVSKLKMLVQGAKAKWKSIFSKNKMEGLGLILLGSMVGLAGFVILLGALFGSGAVGVIVLGSFLMLAGAVIGYLGIKAEE